jgi:hypothetical protein
MMLESAVTETYLGQKIRSALKGIPFCIPCVVPTLPASESCTFTATTANMFGKAIQLLAVTACADRLGTGLEGTVDVKVGGASVLSSVITISAINTVYSFNVMSTSIAAGAEIAIVISADADTCGGFYVVLWCTT